MGAAAGEWLEPPAFRLCAAGARHVIMVDKRCRYTGGNWLDATIHWRHEKYFLSTADLAYESWRDNVLSMASMLYVLAAQLATRAAKPP